MAQTLTAQMLWTGGSGNRIGIKKFVKEGSATGRKYLVVLNGQTNDLDTLLEKIVTSASVDLTSFLASMPNSAGGFLARTVPGGSNYIARTPKLEPTAEGDKADLTIPFEEGLQPGLNNVTGSQTDSEAMAGNLLPADTSFRFVWEPNDVELAFGLPFRPEYKWDLTVGADTEFTFSEQIAYDLLNPAGTEMGPAPAVTLGGLLLGLGYDPDGISDLAVANIWSVGNITEQQRGAFYSYLSNGGPGDDAYEYTQRILRGETSYRYWIPHISITRRYRTPPDTSAYPKPGAYGLLAELSGPPFWTGAPAEDDYSNPFTYLCTGPQVEFNGEFWTVECQWSGFLDFDDELYGDPAA